MDDYGLRVLPAIDDVHNTNLTDHGDPVVGGVPIHLLFWGKEWDNAYRSDHAGGYRDSLTNAVQTVLESAWISGLRQYGPIQRCWLGAVTTTGGNPPLIPDDFDDGDVRGAITDAVLEGRLPADPDVINIYAVFMEDNTHHPEEHGMEIGGKHSHMEVMLADGELCPALWCVMLPGDPGDIDTVMMRFTHEIAELCTDPWSGSWRVDNPDPDGFDEVGDLCNALSGHIDGANATYYWSKHENACILPTAWSVRRTLAWAGRQLNGQGLRSISNPIPSLRKMLIDL